VSPAAKRRPAVLALALAGDVVAVLVFAAVGRRTHAEANALLGLLATAGPFLVGLAAGWATARVWRAPLALRTGLLVWLVTVIVGLAVRFAFTDRLPITFVVVVTLSLAVLLGWRAVAALVSSRTDRLDRSRHSAA
jgi:hypothetical protein